MTLSNHRYQNRALDAERVITSIDKLSERINDRFPDSSLYELCCNLLIIALESQARAQTLMRPLYWVRGGIALLTVVMVVSFTVPFFAVETELSTSYDLGDYIQTIEAAVNNLVLLGAGVFFLVSLENRLKRRRVLRALHELRTVAHVVDMHQLTKDPERLSRHYVRTRHSPNEERLTPLQLSRYLDYCSEMLALVGKVAAVYAQHLDDPAVLASVNDVELLTTELSRKIWQKLMILQAMYGDRAQTATPLGPSELQQAPGRALKGAQAKVFAEGYAKLLERDRQSFL